MLRKMGKEKVIVKFENGISLHYSNWLVKECGHDNILNKLKKTFPIFEKSGYDEKKWIEEFSVIAVKCYPLVAAETVGIIKRFAQASN